MAGALGSGALESLTKPIGTRVIKTFEYDRKGRVVEETTITLSVSMADVIAVLTLAAAMKYGPEVADIVGDPSRWGELPWWTLPGLIGQVKERVF